MLLVPKVAEAAPTRHLHGVVLSLTPQSGTVIVRHDAFGGMPAMTMAFRVIPQTRARELQPGAVIDADVDTSTDPWTLSRVTSTTAQPVTSESILRHVTPLRVGDLVPDTAFVDQRGTPFRFSDARGGDVVLAFVYTRCQDARMCPLISGKFHALQTALAGRKVHLVEVTLDPTYDRPPVLARYGQTFGADPDRWTLAVGDADATLDFAAQFGITTFPDPQIGIIHAEDTALIGPDGRIEEMITDTSWTPDEIVAQIDAQHGRASNPIARFNLWLSKTASAVCGNDVGQFSGLRDLAIVAIIVGALGYLALRLYRAIFAEHA
jgi:cytochrome oxidase Cu insertion factor (SCO1/SenC/PrrC family)/Cu/Ag efflux protein CusF